MANSPESLNQKVDGNLGQKLLKAARLYNEEAIRRTQERGHPWRLAHTRLLPHLSFEGSRLTEVAKRAGITKQSAQRLIDEMVDAGYLEKVDDPQDGRAKMIVYTAKGQQGIVDGLQVLGEIEAALTQAVGAKKMNELGKILDGVLEALDGD